MGNAPEDSEASLRRTRVYGEEERRRKMGVEIQRHPDLVQQRSRGPDCYLQTAIRRRYDLKFVCGAESFEFHDPLVVGLGCRANRVSAAARCRLRNRRAAE